jgi:hypothetical protein
LVVDKFVDGASSEMDVISVIFSGIWIEMDVREESQTMRPTAQIQEL